MRPIITVKNLSKRYQLGRREAKYETLRESIVRGASGLMQGLRTRFHSGGGSRPMPDEECDLWALRALSFEALPGEILGVIGRNGAGKSTLLKILSRITDPTSGDVDLFGRVGSLLEVGTGFHPELTGRENIYLNGAILGMTWAEVNARFDEIVAFSEIEKFLDTPVKQYS